MADVKISQLAAVTAAGVTTPSTAKIPIELAGATVTNYITATELGTLVGQHAEVTAANASIALSGQAINVALDTGSNNLISLAGAGIRADVPNDYVTYAKIQNVSATDKLLGRFTSGAGDIEEISCGAFGRSLIDDADATAARTTLGLGSLATLSSVSYSNIQNVSATSRLLGRASSGAGVMEEITIGSGLTLTGTTLSALGGGSITVSGPDKLLGRVTSGSGAAEEIDCTAAARTILDDASVGAIATTLGLGTGSAVTHERLSVVQSNANQIGLTITGYSLTGSAANGALEITGTWNTTGNASLIKANVAEVAAGGSSRFIDLQLNSVTNFYVRRNGEVWAASSATLGAGNAIIGGSTFGLWAASSKSISIGSDCNWERDAAAMMALRNSTNAQQLNIYNTYTSSTSYERLALDWKTTANTARLVTQKGSGGGTARDLALGTDDTVRMTIAAAGGVTIDALTVTGNTTAGQVVYLAGVTNGASVRSTASSQMDLYAGNSHGARLEGGYLYTRNGIGIAGGSPSTASDVTIRRIAAGIMGFLNASTGGITLELTELAADPSAGASNTARLYSRDNGSGKTQLCVLFPTGAVQVLATEP